jgi:hypothetical protein
MANTSVLKTISSEIKIVPPTPMVNHHPRSGSISPNRFYIDLTSSKPHTTEVSRQEKRVSVDYDSPMEYIPLRAHSKASPDRDDEIQLESESEAKTTLLASSSSTRRARENSAVVQRSQTSILPMDGDVEKPPASIRPLETGVQQSQTTPHPMDIDRQQSQASSRPIQIAIDINKTQQAPSRPILVDINQTQAPSHQMAIDINQKQAPFQPMGINKKSTLAANSVPPTPNQHEGPSEMELNAAIADWENVPGAIISHDGRSLQFQYPHDTMTGSTHVSQGVPKRWEFFAQSFYDFLYSDSFTPQHSKPACAFGLAQDDACVAYNSVGRDASVYQVELPHGQDRQYVIDACFAQLSEGKPHNNHIGARFARMNLMRAEHAIDIS